MHFHLDQAITLAGLAASAFHVEGETPGAITAGAGFRHAGKQLANRCEQAGVGGRVGARRAADRALVDVDHLVEVLQAVERLVGGGFQRGGAIQRGGGQREQGVVDQRRLARAGHPGHAGQQADRDFQVDILQVITAGTLELERKLLVAWGAFGRYGNLHPPGQVLAGQ
ncbi:hypothetical protein D3C75_1040510 [compost metagenome]